MKTNSRGLAHLGAAFKCSAAGIASTFRHEAAFRQEVVLLVPHFAALYFVGCPLWAWVVLTALLGMALTVELLNTALECVVDLVSPNYHELAKRAKDAAGAAVSVCLAVYFIAWALVAIMRFN